MADSNKKSLTLGMKQFTFIFSSIIAFTFCLSSCTPNQYAGEIKTLDSLIVELGKTEKELTSYDPEQASLFYQEIMKNLGLANSVEDMDFETGILFSDYRSTRKGFDNFSKNYPKYTKELDYSKNQLKALIKDLKNNAIPDENAQEFIQTEKEAAIKIIASAKDLSVIVSKANEHFNRYQPKVIEYLDNQLQKEAIETSN